MAELRHLIPDPKQSLLSGIQGPLQRMCTSTGQDFICQTGVMGTWSNKISPKEHHFCILTCVRCH